MISLPVLLVIVLVALILAKMNLVDVKLLVTVAVILLLAWLLFGDPGVFGNT